MAFVPPFNPQVVSPGKFRRFQGVAGLPTQVLKKADENGRDLSDAFANDVQDLNCDIKGEMHLREGCVKIGDGYSNSIIGIFEIRLGGTIQFGFINGIGVLDAELISVPDVPPETITIITIVDPCDGEPPTIDIIIPSDPDVLDVPPDYPTSFPPPKNTTYPYTPPDDNNPPDDPSQPPTEQSCAISHTHVTDPDMLAFQMQTGGTLPDAQRWFWYIRGWWNQTHYGTYAVSPKDKTSGLYWICQFEQQSWTWLEKACDVVQAHSVRVEIKPDAQLLPAGTYQWDDSLIFTDGGAHNCMITLDILDAVMALDYTARTLQETASGIPGTWQNTIAVSNAMAGTTINWTATIISDTSGVLALDVASGSLVGVSSTTVTMSLSSIPANGTYTAVVRFAGNGSPATIDLTVTINIVPDSTADISTHTLYTYISGQNVGPVDTTILLHYQSAGYYLSNDSGSPGWISSLRYYPTNTIPTLGVGFNQSVWVGAGWYVNLDYDGNVLTTGSDARCYNVTVTLNSTTGAVTAFTSAQRLVTATYNNRAYYMTNSKT